MNNRIKKILNKKEASVIKKSIFTLITLLFMGLSLCACENQNDKGKSVVPTYEGMTISRNANNEKGDLQKVCV